jgi:type IV pilus assembly protein PilO
MAGLARARRNFMVALAVLLVLDVAAVAFLFSPWGRSRAARDQEYDNVRVQLQATMSEVRPLQSIEQKLDRARKDTAAFYAQRLPAESSAVSAELGRLAKENSVQISQVKYDFKDADVPDLRQVKIEAKLDGDYLKEVKFINALERDPMFFILDGVNLGESQGGSVHLDLKMETYMKAGQ